MDAPVYIYFKFFIGNEEGHHQQCEALIASSSITLVPELHIFLFGASCKCGWSEFYYFFSDIVHYQFYKGPSLASMFDYKFISWIAI